MAHASALCSLSKLFSQEYVRPMAEHAARLQRLTAEPRDGVRRLQEALSSALATSEIW